MTEASGHARYDLKPVQQTKVVERTKATEMECDRSGAAAGEGKPDIPRRHRRWVGRNRLGGLSCDAVQVRSAQTGPKHMDAEPGVALGISRENQQY